MKHGEDKLRLSGLRARQRKTESKRTMTVQPSGKNISSVAFASVVGRAPYTAGGTLVLPLMGYVLMSFICFPRSFPDRGAKCCWGES